MVIFIELVQYAKNLGGKSRKNLVEHQIIKNDKIRGTCIKGLFWPPLEPKTESCFSPISSYWFIRRIAQV